MSNIASQPDSPEAYRRIAYRHLHLTRKLVFDHASQCIEDDDLYQYQIQVGDEMNTDSDDAIDFGPRFCEPFSATRLEELFKTQDPDENPKFPALCEDADAFQISQYFQALIGVPIYEWKLAAATPWTQTCVSTRHLTLHFEVESRWAMSRIFQITDRSTSHIACTLYDDSEVAPDDRLRRAEVFCAINLMMQAIKLDRKSEFKVVPVFVYSFSSRYARVLQVHFDGENTVVRKTKWLYFPHDRDPTKEIYLYLRWMMNKPIGSTRFTPFPDQESPETGGQEGESAFAVPYEQATFDINA